MFYDRYLILCRNHGVSPSKAALDAGLSKSAVTKWKNDPESVPSAKVIQKLTQYFGISVTDLLEAPLAPAPQPVVIPGFTEGEPVTFYDRFVQICSLRGISPTKAAQDAGISKSLVTKWKTQGITQPTGAVIAKLAAYFDLSIPELMGEAAQPAVTEEDIKFALFGGDGEITDEMYEEVRSFAAFVKEREAAKRRKE